MILEGINLCAPNVLLNRNNMLIFQASYLNPSFFSCVCAIIYLQYNLYDFNLSEHMGSELLPSKLDELSHLIHSWLQNL